MIAELGHFALVLALALCIIQCVIPGIGYWRKNEALQAVARPAAIGQFAFLFLGFVLLGVLFAQSDFSVRYVAQNSNLALPMMYKISAIWGGHEGSLLLWVLMLSGWGVAVSLFSRRLPKGIICLVLATLGAVGVGFMLFMLLTSNPFDRLFPVPMDGRDLNPLLQDPGLIIHPPMLYMGYVGFSVAFAFAIAALITGKMDTAWARWTRPWTTAAWMFLTIGIMLGSWWAYNELGWGGWWFWDPVENASFMPWLVGTALIHSLAVTEKRGQLKSWTALLAIAAFSLSLLGTFLVRSGVLISVHAFATDPARGVFILSFFTVVVGGSMALFAIRGPKMASKGQIELFSREGLLLFNNVFLVVAAIMVLMGTLFPLVIDALGMPEQSVGSPYFNTVFVPLTLPLAALVGLVIAVRWKRGVTSDIRSRLLLPALIAVLVAASLPWLSEGSNRITVFAALLFAFWTAATALVEPVRRVWHRKNRLSALMRLPAATIGMSVAHLGIGVFILGVTMVSSFNVEKDLRMSPGDTEDVGGFSMTFYGASNVKGPNYNAIRGHVVVVSESGDRFDLWPEKRQYPSQKDNPMTEAGINWNLRRDVFVSLGEPLGNGAWSLRAQYKPFIRCIWLGAILMALGGLIALCDRRYRIGSVERHAVAA